MVFKSEAIVHPDEVRKYVDDPFCGFTPSYGFVLDSLYGQAAALDPAVEQVVLRCLEHDPSRRPVSALAVAAA